MTVNTVNNKIYIGVHVTNTPYEFDGYYGCGITGTSCYHFKHPKYPFQKACKKYGLKAFKRYTIMVFDTYEEAVEKEKEIVNEEFIKRADVYNATIGGGSGLVPSTEIEIHQYSLDGHYIKSYRSISSASRELNTSTSNLISALITNGICKDSYWSKTKFMILNIDNYKKKNKKPVYMYNTNLEFIGEFNSESECAKKLDVSLKRIRHAIETKRACNKVYLSLEKVDKFKKSEHKIHRHSVLFQYDLNGNFIQEMNREEVKKICGVNYSKIHDAIREKYACCGFLWAVEHVEKMLPNKRNIRKIEQYDLNGNLIKVWDSYRQCCKEFSNAPYVLNGTRSNTKGYVFKYKIE